MTEENIKWKQKPDGTPYRQCRKCFNLRKRLQRRNSDAYRLRSRNQQRKSATKLGPKSYRAFGGTIEDYRRFQKLQRGKCAICGRLELIRVNDVGRQVGRLNLDHDWVSGEMRGLLCGRCNKNLGWFEKNQKAVLTYLYPNLARRRRSKS